MRQVNLRLLIFLAVILVGGSGAVVALNRFQIYRNADTLAKLARERLEEGRAEDAIALFGRYVALRPNDAQAQSDYARLLLKHTLTGSQSRGSLTQAYNVLETAVRKNPDDDELREKLASFLLRTKNFSDARQHFGTIRENRLRKGNPDTEAAKAGEPLGPNREETQTADASDSRADRTPDALIELRYALSCMGMGRYDEAAAVASKLIGFDIGTKAFDPSWEPIPDCTDAYLLIAEVMERRYNDQDTSARVMRRLPEAYPRSHLGWLAMARWSYFHNDLAAASIEIAKAAELAPDYPDVLFTDFEIAMRSGNYARAGRVINEGMEAFATDPRVIIGRADLTLTQGDAQRALDLLTKGVEAIPDNPILLERLIDVLFNLDRGSEVEPHLAVLREMQGNEEPSVMWAQARLLMSHGQWHQALEMLKSLRPNVAQSEALTHNVDLALAICHQNLGQSDELLEASRRVLADDPNSYQARVALATAHSQAGRIDEALAEFEALAAAQSPEELPSKPLLWGPLLDLRIKNQLRLPASSRDWSEVDKLVDLLAQSPAIQDAQLASIRSNVLFRKDEVPAAIDVVSKALEAAPGDPMLVSQMITLLLANNQAERAREVIEKCPADARRDVRVLSAEARVAASEEETKGSDGLAAVEKAVGSIPTKDAVSVLLTVMTIRIRQGRIDDAERIADVILKREPGELRTHSALLELAVDQKDVDKLTAYAEQIGDVVGLASPQARVAQAMVLILKVSLNRQRQMGEDSVAQPLTADDRASLDEARNLLLEAENDRPGWFQIHQSLAEIAGLRGDTPAAITHLQRAIAQGAVNPDAPRMLAALLRQSGRLEEAREAIAGLGAEAGSGAERIAADIDAQSGRFESAIARAERITPADESSPDHLLWYANLLERCGRGELATEVLQRATTLAPQRPECWLQLITQHLRLGHSRPAEEALLQAEESLSSPDRELVVAATHDMRGRLDAAEDSYRGATAAAPDDPRVGRQLADFLIRRGKITEARDELLRIIAMPQAAGTTSVYWARRMLAQHSTIGVSYRELEKVCRILGENLDAEGRLTPEDVKVEFAILMEREEPASWRRAVALIDDLGRRQELDREHRTLRAWLLDRLGNWVEARESLVDIAAEDGCPPPVIATLIERLIAHGEIVGAKTWYARLRAIAPDAPMTIRSEAKLAIAAEDREGAAEAVRKLIPSGPVTPEIAARLILVAELVEELGFPKAADRILSDCEAASAAGVIARASFLGRQQRTDEAIALLEKAWGRVSELEILDAGANIIRANGTAPSAEADEKLVNLCEKAGALDPESAMVPIVHGAILDLIGRPAEAERIYRELLSRENLPPVLAARASNNLASLIAVRESLDEARDLIEKAVVELGPNPTLLDTRALVWLAAGDTTRAIQDLKESVLVPSATKHLHMAVAQFEARDVAECRAAMAAAETMGIRKERLSAADRRLLERLEKSLADQLGG